MKKSWMMPAVTAVLAYAGAIYADSQVDETNSSEKKEQSVSKQPVKSNSRGDAFPSTRFMQPGGKRIEQKPAPVAAPQAAPVVKNEKVEPKLENIQQEEVVVAEIYESLSLDSDEFIADDDDTAMPMSVDSSTPAQNEIFNYRRPIEKSGFEIFGEYLYWKVQEGATDFAIAQNTLGSSSGTLLGTTVAQDQIGRYNHGTFDWKSGFRVGANYTFDYDAWQLGAVYTNIQPHGSNSVSAPDNSLFFLNGTFFQNVVPGSFSGLVTKAKSRLDLDYQVLDFLLSRRFLASDKIIFTFSMGGTGAWITQDWKVSYFGTIDGVTTDSVNTRKMHWKFEGGGPEVMLDSEWYLGMGFSFFGNIAGSALIGPYHNHAFAINPTIETLPTLDYSVKDHRVVPHLEMGLGAMWGNEYVAVKAGYEWNVWWNLQEVYRTVTAGATTDKTTIKDDGLLLLNGLTVRASVYF